jgi:CubicO group peptidase (beta-lactamase class C family)
MARYGVPATASTLFHWFCTIKPAVAIAFAQLWERGLVDPDSTVASVLPEFGSGGKDTITFRHLLTHTAGIDDLPPELIGAARDEVLAAICGAPLPEGLIPGRQARYSRCAAWFILAESFARIDGRPYQQYQEEEIFSRLGIADIWTALTPLTLQEQLHRIALCYDTSTAEGAALPQVNDPTLVGICQPGVFALGTSAELGHLFESLLLPAFPGQRPLLRSQTTEAITAKHRVGLRDDDFAGYVSWGLGLTVDGSSYASPCSSRTFGHKGLSTSFALADPEHALVIAAVFNGMPSSSAAEQRNRGVIRAVYRDLDIYRATPAAPRILRARSCGGSATRQRRLS